MASYRWLVGAFAVRAEDYAEPDAESRLPLMTVAEARLAVRVLLASADVAGEQLGRDLARRLPAE